MTSSVKNNISSFALIGLSIAISYFAYALINVGNKIPQVVSTVDQLDKRLPMILKEVEAYRLLIPDILAETKAYREQIPLILQRVDHMQAQIEAVRKEIPATLDKNLPQVLARVDKTQQQIDQLYLQLPAILETVNSTTKTIENTKGEITNIITLVPSILAESKAIRGDIPGYFDQADSLLNKAGTISEEAGKGVFTGLLKGIVAAPFALLRAPGKLLGKDLKYSHLYTDEDYKLVVKATEELLSSEKNSSKTWRNPTSKNQGVVTVNKSYIYQGKKCKKLSLEILVKNGQKETVNKDVCLNDKKQWTLVD